MERDRIFWNVLSHGEGCPPTPRFASIFSRRNDAGGGGHLGPGQGAGGGTSKALSGVTGSKQRLVLSPQLDHRVRSCLENPKSILR